MKTSLFVSIKRKWIIRYITRANPEKLATTNFKKLKKIMRYAYRHVPFYKGMGINMKALKNIDSYNSFKNAIPVIDKVSLFANNKLPDIFVKGETKGFDIITASSGFSGTYSFGVDQKKNERLMSHALDTSLEHLFHISDKKTLFISCEPMGVKMYTSLTLAETSVRQDTTLAIIAKFSPYYNQTVILGDPYFVKNLVDLGNQQNINWQAINSSFIIGGDWYPESLREYIEKAIGMEYHVNAERKVIGTMGITELGLNLFQETPHTIGIRKACGKNPELCSGLFGENHSTVPILFHYFPHRYYLETLPNVNGGNDLLFTMLHKGPIPMIRYNSKDEGQLISYDHCKKILLKHGYTHLVPDFKLPLVAIHGRSGQYVKHQNKKLCPNDIKQLLFENTEIGQCITGQFMLSEEKGEVALEIQLVAGKIQEKQTVLIETFIKEKLGSDLNVQVFGYRDYPHGMVMDFERKIRFT